MEEWQKDALKAIAVAMNDYHLIDQSELPGLLLHVRALIIHMLNDSEDDATEEAKVIWERIGYIVEE